MLITTGYMPSTKEDAVKLVDEKVASIKDILKDIMNIADHHELTIAVLNDWDDYLRYTGRPYEEYDTVGGMESYRTDNGGWYHSTC